MSPSAKEQFQDLKSHWALQAIGTENLEHAEELVNENFAQQAVGQQIIFNFDQSIKDISFLDRVALAYELAAIEGLDQLSRPNSDSSGLRNQAIAASFKAFDIRRLLPVPEHTQERLYFILQLSALAYCGDRWPDLLRWYKENQEMLNVPSSADVSWDQRLLYKLFDCWVRLFRKNGWDDLDRIREIISGLREDQQTMERHHLSGDSQALDRVKALRLAALYHWARTTEIIASYMLQGQPTDPFSQIDKHFEAGIKSATASGDAQYEIILRWLHATGRIMITNSLWWTTRTVNSQTSDFVRSLTKREHQAMYELLPPQRAALLEQGLLDQAKTAIVIDLPTSGGKTLLAQFRILQALNQFSIEKGWVAYVAPTRALTAQLTRRLRKDFNPIDLRVEQLTAAIEVDAFEEELLSDVEQPFDILISTPEKLSLVIRNKKITRPLALLVMDEAHNLEDDSRGMRIEFLLATIKRESPKTNFLLLMPYVESSESIARWLAQDIHAGQAISLGTTPWKPNERIIGIYRAVEDSSERAGWRLQYETLTTTEKTMPLHGIHDVGKVKPINVPRSTVISKNKQKGFALQTAAIGTVMSARGTSIAIANRIQSVWNMATQAAQTLPAYDKIPKDIDLVQDFLRTEMGSDFPLIKTLQHGIGVHHAGLSDDVRGLMEWLAETGCLRMLCATSTIAQGINFPVSSVFLASRFIPGKNQSVEMSPRDFWNLAGRAGRLGQDSVGVIGLAEGRDREEIIEFVSHNTEKLVSRLVTLLDELTERGSLSDLSEVLWQDQWEDFRCYVTHLWNEKRNLEEVLAESEQLLRQTYGYVTLRNDPTTHHKADALLNATQFYARKLAEMRPGITDFADSTGFSPEGVNKAMAGLKGLEKKLTPSDWSPDSLFGEGGNMAALFGVMLKVPQLKDHLEQIGGKGLDHSRISNMTRDWVNGKSIGDIARDYFSDDRNPNDVMALSDACRAVYRAIVNNGTWGISALSQISGLDFDSLSEADLRRVNALPAMIYYGVRSEEAVLMRMNTVPRSAAESLGNIYKSTIGENEDRFSVGRARSFLKSLTLEEWEHARPTNAALSGSGYRRVWRILSGEKE